MKARVRLETITDIGNFVVAVETATASTDKVYVTDGDRMCVNAKSFLGLIHAREFNKIYVESEKDIYTKIKDFIIEEDSPFDE
jgi:uncharacterized protein (DUF169 family)